MSSVVKNHTSWQLENSINWGLYEN